jgi:hypothetical protein
LTEIATAPSANVISFAEAKAKLTPNGQLADRRDFNAFLAKQGRDRAWVDEAYNTLVADEDTQASAVASYRADIATMRELRARKQKMLDTLQADINRYIKIERGLEEQMSIAKYKAILQLMHGHGVAAGQAK